MHAEKIFCFDDVHLKKVSGVGDQPAIFIDRDGVINREQNYVHKVEDFHFLSGAINALGFLQAAGFVLVVVTNQAGIAHGLFGPEEFSLLTKHMLKQLAFEGVHINGVFYCPHHPQGRIGKYRTSCSCRKPQPGLILGAAEMLKLDVGRSFLVGDKVSDVLAGRAAGVGVNILVRSGHILPADAEASADVIVNDLWAAAKMIATPSASLISKE